MNKKVAVIDLGTNTFQFGIAEIGKGIFTFIFEKSLPPKLGKGGITEGFINQEAINRAKTALEEFVSIANSHGIEANEILAFGTSAIRNAKNKEAFCQEIENALGIVINVISGDTEANLIAEGVRYAIDFQSDPFLIMDIGGGSVEFIIANKSTIFWKQSFEIGGQRLMDQFFDQDPISPLKVRKLQSYLEEKLIPLSNAMHQYSAKTLVGSAGSFETLADIFNASIQTFVPANQGVASDLPISSFYSSYAKFLEFNRNERLAIAGMIELRVDMIVVASVLIDYVIKAFEIDEIKVSNFALKEGVLAKMAMNEPI